MCTRTGCGPREHHFPGWAWPNQNDSRKLIYVTQSQHRIPKNGRLIENLDLSVGGAILLGGENFLLDLSV